MRHLMTGLACVVFAVAAAAQGDFTTTLTPEERAAAGLDKLSAAELTRLRALVERYKAGEVGVVQQQAEQQVAAVRQEAEQKVAAAEAKAREAEKAEPPAAARQPGWLSALVTLQRVADKPEAQEPLESRMAAEFRGWRSNTVFILENGQRWQVDGTEAYVTPPQPAPRVKIKPGMLGSYWMEIEGVRPKVKVKPVQL